MKSNKIWGKMILLITCCIMILGIVIYIIYLSRGHIDFSQSYRKIDGFENILFKDAWSEETFRLCVWGLLKTDYCEEFQDHRNFDRSSYEYQILMERVDTSGVEQIVLSPDKDYILYVERIYRGTGITDDEDVYYRVYSIKDDTITTIFSGYRQFLLVDWKK